MSWREEDTDFRQNRSGNTAVAPDRPRPFQATIDLTTFPNLTGIRLWRTWDGIPKTAARPTRLGKNNPMPGVCTTCTEMSPNWWKMAGMIPTAPCGASCWAGGFAWRNLLQTDLPGTGRTRDGLSGEEALMIGPLIAGQQFARARRRIISPHGGSVSVS